MIYLLAAVAVYYLVGLVGSYKLGISADPTVSHAALAFVSIFWPVALFITYAKEASR